MKRSLLLPHRFKWIGVFITTIFFPLGVACLYFHFDFSFLTLNHPSVFFASDDFFSQNFTDEIALTFVIIGLLFIAFSKEKMEDEYINIVRLESWQWSIIINYLAMIICVWLLYGDRFNYYLCNNLITVLLLFIIRFHVVLHRHRVKR
jgi:hypothetical protein